MLSSGLILLFAICYVASPAYSLDPATIAAVSSAIIAGGSLGGSTLNQLMSIPDYGVTCGIEVENWTRWPLSHPGYVTNAGYMATPPRTIAPGQKEIMIAHKTSNTATGTYGTVSWSVGQDWRVVLMWSAPYSFDFHSNYLAVGIARGWSHQDLFRTMYYNSDRRAWFRRAEYYSGVVSTLVYENSWLEVRAIMGTSHQAAVKVLVLPKNNDNLADSVKTMLQHTSRYQSGK